MKLLHILFNGKILVFLLACGFGLQSAQNPAHRFGLGPPQKRRIVVEKAYEFYVMGYEEPIRVEPQDSVKAGHNTIVEFTAIAILSAEARGNYETYLGLVSEKMKAELDTPTRRQELIAAWKRKHEGKRAELVQHVRFRSHTIIRYRLVPDDAEVAAETYDLVCQPEGNRGWVLIDTLDPVLLREWDFEGNVKTVRDE